MILRTKLEVLLIEDDASTALYVTEGLQDVGHDVHWAPTGADGLNQAQNYDWGAMIVDRMLPGMDGLAIVQTLRANGNNVPVLFLTTMGGLDDRIEGLNAGGDDYLIKPFEISELIARMNAVFRRTTRDNSLTSLKAGTLELDLIDRIVLREGKEIDLQPQEFKLLEYLARNAGRAVTRTMLLENVWKLTFDPGTNIVESHMSRLRSKIDRGFDKELIATLRGYGYILCA
jgi:two-component system OmpR family response regulator